jgi:hypothetical protein
MLLLLTMSVVILVFVALLGSPACRLLAYAAGLVVMILLVRALRCVVATFTS